MADVEDETRQLLEDRPAIEDALQEILRVDSDGPWTFEDIDVDSGTFGEVVSRGLVEKTDDAYRVVEPDIVQTVLEGETVETTDESTGSVGLSALSLPDVDTTAVLALCGALLLVVAVRVVFMWNKVFRDGYVVLAGNDPWGYRYYVEQLLAAGVSPFALGSLSEYLGTGLAQDQLYVVVAWWTALLFGGTPRAAGLALAWLPVVSAVLTALVVYLLTIRLTADRRVGLSAVVLLALTPVHAYRTALGFGDHHAFDYFWLALTVYALVVIATVQHGREETAGEAGISIPRSTAAWAGAVLLGIGIAAQSLAWRAGPLLFLPVGGYAVYRAVSDVRAGSSPLFGNLPLIAGVALASLLAAAPASVWAWPVTWIRSFAPALLLGGVVGVLLLGEIGYRLDLPAKGIAGGGFAIGLLSVGIAWFTLPEFVSTVDGFFAYLERTGNSGIAETYSLFSGNLGSIVGPLLILGLVLYLAVPYVGLALWQAYRNHRPGWALVGMYAVYFLLLATVQLRFAGQLALFAAVFAGIGFVHLAAVVDLTTRPRVLEDWRPDSMRSATDGGRLPSFEIPDRTSLGYLLVLCLLVTSIGLVQIPVKQGQIAVDEDTFRTAEWLSSNATSLNQSNSDGYVLSNWGQNRVYNYFLDGDSEWYGYAQQNYADFLQSTNESEWYERLNDRNASVITEPVNVSGSNSLQVRLHENHGSETEQSDALSHYRLRHVSDSGDRKVFSLVPGASITGQAPPNETIQLQTNRSVSGTTFTYERTVRTTMSGWYSATVPYPSHYTSGNSTYVTETAVTSGEFVANRSGNARWPLEAGRGSVAFDVEGGNHARIHGASWVQTDDGRALSFDGDDTVIVPNASELQGDEFTLSVRFRTLEGVDYVNETRFPRLVSTAPASSYQNTSGYTIAMAEGDAIAVVGNGQKAIKIRTERIDDADWHWATIVRNGNGIRFYIDDVLVGTDNFNETIRDSRQLVIGGSTDQRNRYRGMIDTIIFNRSDRSPLSN